MGDLARYLADHHGVLTRSQAVELGVSPNRIRGLVRRGEWIRVHAGVYRVASAADTWWARCRAGALSVRGLVSHQAALRVWGVNGCDRYRPFTSPLGVSGPGGPWRPVDTRSGFTDPTGSTWRTGG